MIGHMTTILHLSKLTPNTINKSLWAFKILLEEYFEVGLHDESDVFVTALVFSPLDADKAIEE